MTEKVTPLLRARIFKCFETHKNADGVAKELQVDVKTVRHILKTRGYYEQSDGRGPATLKPYIVAVRTIEDQWDNTQPEIKKARKDYDDGKVELCQGRDGDNIILYAIPKRRQVDRKPFFGD